MSNIEKETKASAETSAETFESILKGILKGCKGDDIDKLGSEIENEALLSKLNLAKEDDVWADDDYKFDESKDITGLDDSEKIKIANILTDSLEDGYFEGYEEKINELVRICPKNIGIIKIEIDSIINKMIESNKNTIDETYNNMKLTKDTQSRNMLLGDLSDIYAKYQKIEEAIREKSLELNKCDENFKKLFNEICGAKLEILNKYKGIDGVEDEIKALKSLEESSKIKKIEASESVRKLFEQRIEEKNKGLNKTEVKNTILQQEPKPTPVVPQPENGAPPPPPPPPPPPSGDGVLPTSPSLPRDEQNNKKESSELIIDKKLLESLEGFIGLIKREEFNNNITGGVLGIGLAMDNKELTLDKLQKLQSSFQTKSKSNEEEAIDELIDFLEKYKTERQKLNDIKLKNIDFDLLEKSLERLQELVLIENKEGILDKKIKGLSEEISKIKDEISKLEDWDQEGKEEKEEEREEREKEKERYESMKKKNGLSEEEKKEKENLEKISQIVSKKLELCILAKSAKKENDHNEDDCKKKEDILKSKNELDAKQQEEKEDILKEDAKNLLDTLKNQQNEKSAAGKILDAIKKINNQDITDENHPGSINQPEETLSEWREYLKKLEIPPEIPELKNSETRGLESETKPTPTEEAKSFSEEEMAKMPRKNLWPQAKDLVPILQYIQANPIENDGEPEEIERLRKIKEGIDEYCKDGKPFPIGDIHGDPVLFVSYMVLSGNASFVKIK